MRQAGILFPISCLPSKSGIGDFGPEAYKLVDWLEKTGVGIWQILPLNPLGFGYSPYQTLSSYAIEPLYLSLELLEKEGLIEKAPQLAATDSIDYQQVQKLKEPYYKEFTDIMLDCSDNEKKYIMQAARYAKQLIHDIKS